MRHTRQRSLPAEPDDSASQAQAAGATQTPRASTTQATVTGTAAATGANAVLGIQSGAASVDRSRFIANQQIPAAQAAASSVFSSESVADIWRALNEADAQRRSNNNAAQPTLLQSVTSPPSSSSLPGLRSPTAYATAAMQNDPWTLIHLVIPFSALRAHPVTPGGLPRKRFRDHSNEGNQHRHQWIPLGARGHRQVYPKMRGTRIFQRR